MCCEFKHYVLLVVFDLFDRDGLDQVKESRKQAASDPRRGSI